MTNDDTSWKRCLKRKHFMRFGVSHWMLLTIKPVLHHKQGFLGSCYRNNSFKLCIGAKRQLSIILQNQFKKYLHFLWSIYSTGPCTGYSVMGHKRFLEYQKEKETKTTLIPVQIKKTRTIYTCWDSNTVLQRTQFVMSALLHHPLMPIVLIPFTQNLVQVPGQ